MARAVTLLLLVSPQLAQAAEDAAHGPNYRLLALQILNTAVLLGLLIYFGRAPIRSFFATRSRDIQEAIGAAKGRLDEAEGRLAELEERLSGIDGESSRLVDDSETLARAESERAIERAERSAGRLREEAERVADQEIARARSELQAEAAELATELAGEMLREQIGADDDRRLVRDFVERSGRSA